MDADETWYTYDISNLVRKWHGGENNGFALNLPPVPIWSCTPLKSTTTSPVVVDFNGVAYAYLYNQQDDVIGLVDSNGTKWYPVRKCLR